MPHRIPHRARTFRQLFRCDSYQSIPLGDFRIFFTGRFFTGHHFPPTARPPISPFQISAPHSPATAFFSPPGIMRPTLLFSHLAALRPLGPQTTKHPLTPSHPSHHRFPHLNIHLTHLADLTTQLAHLATGFAILTFTYIPVVKVMNLNISKYTCSQFDYTT